MLKILAKILAPFIEGGWLQPILSVQIDFWRWFTFEFIVLGCGVHITTEPSLIYRLRLKVRRVNWEVTVFLFGHTVWKNW